MIKFQVLVEILSASPFPLIRTKSCIPFMIFSYINLLCDWFFSYVAIIILLLRWKFFIPAVADGFSLEIKWK